MPETIDHDPRTGGQYCRPSTLIIGLGNDLLSDDGVGLYIARCLRNRLDTDRYDIRESSAGGMEIAEHLAGYKRAVIIDACQTGRNPVGTLTHHRPEDSLATLRLNSYHTVSFPTALGLARLLGVCLPQQIDVFAVEVEDIETISESCTEKVRDRVAALADEIAEFLRAGEQIPERQTLSVSVNGRDQERTGES